MASSLNVSSLQGYYDSFESLFDDAQTVSLAQGFAIRILRSQNFYRGQYTRYDIACVCEGQQKAPKSHQKRVQRPTLRCGCEFRLRAVFRQHVSLWELMILETSHNHEPHDKPHEIAAHRRHLRRANARFEVHLDRLSRLGTKTVAEIAQEL